MVPFKTTSLNVSADGIVGNNFTVTNVLSVGQVQVRTRGTSNVFIGNATTGRNAATGNHNFVFGLSAGNALTTGSNNVFIGNCAGNALTNGSSNVFIGPNAGLNLGICNLDPFHNVFIGLNAGCGTRYSQSIIFPSYQSIDHNVAIGYNAGRKLSTTSWNTGYPDYYICIRKSNNNIFIGSGAGRNSTACSFYAASNNNFLGFQAGYSNCIGSSNNFFGYRAGFLNTTGDNNNFFGRYAGRSNTTGNYNNFFGNSAGRRNTTGFSNNFLGNNAGYCNCTGGSNNFFGNFAGRSNTTGGSNNFFGPSAGFFNCTGSLNNFLGQSAGVSNTTGRFNNFLGSNAGCTNTIGSNNTIIGNSANVATNALSGVIVLGTGAVATESHQVVLSTANVVFRNIGDTFQIGSPNLTDNLTVFGTVSTSNHGNSQQWNSAYTTVQANSASWEESAEILPTVTNYLSTSNVLMSGVNVTTDIIANRIQATVKNFYIDHPTKPGKHLVYSSLETPYNGIQLTGQGVLKNGVCAVELPKYISNLIHEDDVHIQLTNYKHSTSLYVDSIEIEKNRFTVKSNSWFSKFKTAKFFWLLNGVRKDIPKLETEV